MARKWGGDTWVGEGQNIGEHEHEGSERNSPRRAEEAEGSGGMLATRATGGVASSAWGGEERVVWAAVGPREGGRVG